MYLPTELKIISLVLNLPSTSRGPFLLNSVKTSAELLLFSPKWTCPNFLTPNELLRRIMSNVSSIMFKSCYCVCFMTIKRYGTIQRNYFQNILISSIFNNQFYNFFPTYKCQTDIFEIWTCFIFLLITFRLLWTFILRVTANITALTIVVQKICVPAVKHKSFITGRDKNMKFHKNL